MAARVRARQDRQARKSLAYLLTGDARYLEAARKWMMTLASWDPKGITSHGLPQPDGSIGNDEASMPMMERMAMAWDWIGDKLTAEERRQVLASMEERGNQVLRKLEADDFLSHLSTIIPDARLLSWARPDWLSWATSRTRAGGWITCCAATWSPDGRTLAYCAQRDGNFDLMRWLPRAVPNAG